MVIRNAQSEDPYNWAHFQETANLRLEVAPRQMGVEKILDVARRRLVLFAIRIDQFVIGAEGQLQFV